MIRDEYELREARRRLRLVESGLEELRNQLLEENPALYPTVSAGYEHQIHRISEDIQEYLANRGSAGAFHLRVYGAATDDGRVPATLLAKLLTVIQELLRREAKPLVGDPAVLRQGVQLKFVRVRTGVLF